MRHRSTFAAALVAVATTAPAIAAPLDGATLDISQSDLFFGFTFTDNPFVVGPGIETTATAGFPGAFTFDFTGSGLLTITFFDPANIVLFGGTTPFIFSDVLGTLPAFTGFTLIDTPYPGITDSDLTFTDDTLSFDFNGAYSTGDVLTAQITLFEEMPPIPLPASLPLLAGGALALAALAHSRRV